VLACVTENWETGVLALLRRWIAAGTPRSSGG
jgi:hypothetical protein